MLNLDTFLPTLLLMTRFAESYSEGTYGSGSYNEGGSTTTSSPATPAPTQANSPNVTTTQVSETPTATAEPPVTTTTQPVTQQTTAAEADAPIGTDLMWIIIASTVAVAALIALFIVITKKLSRR